MAYQLFFDLSLPIVPGQYAQNLERFELSPLGVAFPIKEGGIQRTEVKFGKVEVTLFEAQKINECNRLITTVEARLSISTMTSENENLSSTVACKVKRSGVNGISSGFLP